MPKSISSFIPHVQTGQKSLPSFKLVRKRSLYQAQVVEMYTLILTKMAQKWYPLGRAYLFSLHRGNPPPPESIPTIPHSFCFLLKVSWVVER